MVVDDEPTQRMAASLICRSLGIQTILDHENARDALTDLEGKAKAVDLVICDLDLPEMDGMEFIRRIGQMSAKPAILIVSGHPASVLDSVETMARAYGLTVMGSVGKPLTKAVLEPVLDQLDALETTIPNHPGMSAAELDGYIDGGRFEPFFQPQVQLSDGRVQGAEVLARLIAPGGAVYGPDVFLSRIEERDMAADFTLGIIEQALEMAHQWPEHMQSVTLSFNLSPAMIDDLSIMGAILERIDLADTAPERLIFEVLETAMAQNPKVFMENAARLRLRGFGLALDDYGQGHSTLDQLRRLPFSELKIDRAFVTGLSTDASKRAIVSNTIAMSRDLNLKVVAEGVETEAEAAMLNEFGCDLAQGFLYADALNADEFVEFVGRCPEFETA